MHSTLFFSPRPGEAASELKRTTTEQDALIKIISIDHCYALNMKIKSEDDFECHTCKKVFASKSRLLRHINEHCSTKPAKNYSCVICEKTFTYNGLRDHYRNYTVQGRKFRGKHNNFNVDHHLDLVKKLKQWNFSYFIYRHCLKTDWIIFSEYAVLWIIVSFFVK